MINFSLKIGGEAGFGIASSGLIFSKIASRLGYFIFDLIEYPSLVRGGHNAYEINVADYDISHLKTEIDILICLNKETFEKHKHRLHSKSFIIYDSEEFQIKEDYQKINIPFKRIVSQLKGNVVMRNTIALGAVFGLLSAPIDEFLKIIKEQFLKKGEEIIKFNQEFAKKGYQYVLENYSQLIVDWLKKKEKVDEKLVISGNEAFSLGAVVSDCRLYCAYPMTPSSSVLHTLASWQEKTGMIIRHSEDEIAVINTALGASFAGVRTAVGTSGGGFALMVESISLAGITETPIVIFLAQRPGPATGMPTWTEQGDLLFACFAGHGEFPKIVLAPGDQEEMFDLTLKAFNLADVYQLPVIILSDMFLSEGHKGMNKDWFDSLVKNYQINRGKIINKISNLKSPTCRQARQISIRQLADKSQNFLRYKITDDGISERLLPGTPGYFYQVNSYEHLEDGHTTEESQKRVEQADKRNKKWQTYLKNDFQMPNYYGDEDAEIIFVSWGSNKGAIIGAQKILRDKGLKTGFYHFNYLYPLNKQKIKEIFKPEKRYILIENNSWGQFGKLLTMETGVEIKEKILRYDGRAITSIEIINQLTS